jgi:hypothetical protein
MDQYIQYVRYDLRVETVCDLRFLDDDDWMKTMIGLTEFVLNVMTLDVHPMKR